MAPCVGWHPVPKQRGGGGWPWAGPSDGEELQEEDGYLVSPRVDLSPPEVRSVRRLNLNSGCQSDRRDSSLASFERQEPPLRTLLFAALCQAEAFMGNMRFDL